MIQKTSVLAVLISVAACSRPAPTLIERLQAPKGGTEIALWHEEAAGTLDSSMLLTINKPNASFSSRALKATIKRGREVEAYWTVDDQPVLLVRDLNGWVNSGRGSLSFVVCGLKRHVCMVALKPTPQGESIKIGTYHSGESEPF